MAYSNSTTNYNLPQYAPTDKPKYLSDFNNAMETIDTSIKSVSNVANGAKNSIEELNTKITSVENTANTAKSTADTANTNATNAKATANTANTNASSAKTTADNALNKATINHNILASFFDGFTNIDNWSPTNTKK